MEIHTITIHTPTMEIHTINMEIDTITITIESHIVTIEIDITNRTITTDIHTITTISMVCELCYGSVTWYSHNMNPNGRYQYLHLVFVHVQRPNACLVVSDGL